MCILLIDLLLFLITVAQILFLLYGVVVSDDMADNVAEKVLFITVPLLSLFSMIYITFVWG